MHARGDCLFGPWRARFAWTAGLIGASGLPSPRCSSSGLGSWRLFSFAGPVQQDLRDAARRALRLVVRANSRYDRVPVLLELREELEEPKVADKPHKAPLRSALNYPLTLTSEKYHLCQPGEGPGTPAIRAVPSIGAPPRAPIHRPRSAGLEQVRRFGIGVGRADGRRAGRQADALEDRADRAEAVDRGEDPHPAAA